MPPYRVVPGAPGSPVVLHVPHGSRVVPGAVRRRLLLGDGALEAELDLMTDGHTGALAAGAAGRAAARPWVFENLTSRLVVDPERFPDEREEMRAAGMGAVYTRTAHGKVLRADDKAHEEELLAAYFRPYARAVTRLVDERLAATGRAAVIDVHSYPSRALPYELRPGGERPVICIGTDGFHTPAWLLGAALEAFAPCGRVALDSPFAGCYVPLRHWRRTPAVSALMVEVRRDAYQVEPFGPLTGGFDPLVRALARLADAAASAPR